MKYLGVNALREEFVSFFEKRGHKRFHSFSLVPEDDDSLLLINSGMAPLKKYFLGQKKCEGNRATDCQKCIRTPDIDRVGQTSRHGTFFEMLGNFSFGDYFKKEAIAWAWEFATKVIEIPVDKIYVTVYEGDDETYRIWVEEIGVAPSHMKRLGKEDNFWEIGTGPCGPCTELYYDRGEELGCKSPDCGPGCDCDRYIEFWNLVFSQFNSDGKGNYSELEQKNIDTGMGLERLACIVQGVDNLFEIDTVKRILQAVCRVTNKAYNKNKQDDISIRVITDHIRGSVFLISDKVMPSTEGCGYVLRRLLRRAMRHGRKLGVNFPFLFELCDVVIDENKEAYPELQENRAHIKSVVKNEEERFLKTIDQGLSLLYEMLDDLNKKGQKTLPGELAFKLYDTFGFPLEIVEEVAGEAGIAVERAGFLALMEKQKQMARDARKKAGDKGWVAQNEETLKTCPQSRFVGYEKLEAKTKLIWLCKGEQSCQEVQEEEVCQLALEQTPFYATGGGQASDGGVIFGPGGKLEVLGVQKFEGNRIIITAEVKEGRFELGQEVLAQVDQEKRRATCKNHSACHILQRALREILGDHVAQAGSYVDENKLRFDFSHFKPMTKGELEAVCARVNEVIFAELPVCVQEMSLDEAKKTGAMALFDEKYGERVRVCNIGDYSKELCGGTHVFNTAQINMFRLLSETSVSAGVRRIEAVTGANVLKEIQKTDKLLESLEAVLKAGSGAELEQKALGLANEARELKQTVARQRARLLEITAEGLLKSAGELKGLTLICGKVPTLQVEELRSLCDILKGSCPNLLAVLTGQKNSIIVVASQPAIAAGLEAGKLVKAICQRLGGSGGGKKETAMGSAPCPGELEDVVRQVVGKL